MAQSVGVHNEIAVADDNFMAIFGDGDATALAELYTEDAQLLPPNSDFVIGKEAIRAFWQSIMDMGIKAVKLEIIEVAGHGDTAIEMSRFTLEDKLGQALDKGKYIVVWKREGGQWKLHRDIFNSNMPAQKQ